jgi:hypothetical protein
MHAECESENPNRETISRAWRKRVVTSGVQLREKMCEVVDWVQLAQDRIHWMAVLNTIMNIHVP